MNIVVNVTEENVVYYYGHDYVYSESGLDVIDPANGNVIFHITDLDQSNSKVFDVPDEGVPADMFAKKYRYVQQGDGYQFVINEKNIDPLRKLRAQRTDEITEYRNAYVGSNIIYGGLEFQSDPVSLQLMNNAITGILSVKSFDVQASSIVWTLADNSTVILEANELLQMGTAVTAFVSDCYIAARAHKDIVLHDLESREEVLNYDYTSNWWPARDLGGTLIHAP